MATNFPIDWDTGNWPKCGKHGVAQAEIVEVFAGDPTIFADPKHSTVEERLLAVGQTKAGRHVFIAFTFRRKAGALHIRPVSARFMHDREIRFYGKT
jgi:uncharacterized DUF497 family protein